MKQYICLLILLMIVLFAYNLLKRSYFIEPLENKDDNNSNNSNSCQANTLIYKNAGSIQNLQDKIKQLMEQITKYDKLAQQADSLANDNKQRLFALAKQAKAKYDAGAKESNNLPSP